MSYICIYKPRFHSVPPQNKSSDIMLRSVLGHMLPEAMVCYLENYDPDKFAQIFLGEFDTPEAIWNSEMRYDCLSLKK